jgi:hypothetical protein
VEKKRTYERIGSIGTSMMTQKQKMIHTDYSNLNPFSVISELNSKQYINQRKTCLFKGMISWCGRLQFRTYNHAKIMNYGIYMNSL